MKTVLIFIAFVGCVLAENCAGPNDCLQTNCNTQNGWWLHCMSGVCSCTHDSHVSKACPDGSTATCIALHGDGCVRQGLHWKCIDNNCHCTMA